ncbi:MAG: hypothetical protein HJJLKODD_01752 [Phycisphaerae bacterium]|nr:hypothetical protein [Phycisphaerae bacterium]
MNQHRREKIITLLLAVALVGLFALGLARPRALALGALQKETIEITKDTADLRITCTNIGVLQNMVNERQRQAQEAGARIPTEDPLYLYERFAKEAAQRHQIARLAIDFLSGAAKNQINSRAVRINFQASAPAAMQYLLELEHHPQLSVVRRLQVSPASAGSPEGTFEVMLVVDVYFGKL